MDCFGADAHYNNLKKVLYNILFLSCNSYARTSTGCLVLVLVPLTYALSLEVRITCKCTVLKSLLRRAEMNAKANYGKVLS